MHPSRTASARRAVRRAQFSMSSVNGSILSTSSMVFRIDSTFPLYTRSKAARCTVVLAPANVVVS